MTLLVKTNKASNCLRIFCLAKFTCQEFAIIQFLYILFYLFDSQEYMKRASSQGSLNMRAVSAHSKEKMRKTIKSALGRQQKQPSKQNEMARKFQMNSRACSTKSLISSRKSAYELEGNSQNFYRKFNQKKINYQFFDEKLSVRNSQMQAKVSSEKTSRVNIQKPASQQKTNRNMKQQPKSLLNSKMLINPQRQIQEDKTKDSQTMKAVASYEWWHLKKKEIETQHKIRGTQNSKEYLTYFAYAKGVNGKKRIIVAFENFDMFLGDPGLLVFGISNKDSEGKGLNLNSVPYQPRLEINHKFSHYLICSANIEGKSFINKQFENIRNLVNLLARAKIEHGEGSQFYLLIEIKKELTQSIREKDKKIENTNIQIHSLNKQENTTSKKSSLKIKALNKI